LVNAPLAEGVKTAVGAGTAETGSVLAVRIRAIKMHAENGAAVTGPSPARIGRSQIVKIEPRAVRARGGSLSSTV
jgi:hypothetical protein